MSDQAERHRLAAVSADVAAIARVPSENLSAFERRLRDVIDCFRSEDLSVDAALRGSAVASELVEAISALIDAERRLNAVCWAWLESYERKHKAHKLFILAGRDFFREAAKLSGYLGSGSLTEVAQRGAEAFNPQAARLWDDPRANMVRELATWWGKPLAAEPEGGARQREKQQRTPRRRGRPLGSRQHREFRALVHCLLAAATDSGGHLTFSSRYPEAGSLWRAIVRLSPFLPKGLVPRVPPGSRLAGACAEWRAYDRKVIGKSHGPLQSQ